MPSSTPNLPTLSRTLLWSILPWIVSIVVLSGLVLHLLVARQSTVAFDAQLLAKAEGLILITEQDEDGVEFELLPEAQPRYFTDSDADYFEISDSSDAALFRSSTLGELRLSDDETREQTRVTVADGDPVFRDLRLPDGRPGRIVVAGYYPKIDLDNEMTGEASRNPSFALPGQIVLVAGDSIVPVRLTVRVAASRVPLDDQLRTLDLIFVGSALATILLTLFSTQRAVRRALRPLRRLTRELAAIGDASLDRRLSDDAELAELDSLTRAFNGLLANLQRAFVRERQFSSDVAHELRTPLAELRSHVEVGRRFPRDEVLRASLIDDVDSATQRMQSLTVNLLALSRNELGIDRASAPADLGSIVEEALSSHADAASLRALTIDLDVPLHPTPVIGREHWESLLTNLLDNAISYAPIGSRIAIRLAHIGSASRLEISNLAPDLDTDDLQHLFDRLWRKDASRQSGRHSGLGLALVKAYAKTLGVQITASLDQGRLQFTLSAEQVRPAVTSSVTRPA